MKDVIAVQAKENQKRKPKSVSQNSVEQIPIDTQKELAKSAGVSHDTIHKVEVVLDKGTPEIQEAVRTGDISINNAYHETVQSTLPPERPRKPLQFEDVIRKVAKLLDEATAGLDVLVENAELFHSEQYGKALEKWKLSNAVERLVIKINKLRGGTTNEEAERPEQAQIEEQN